MIRTVYMTSSGLIANFQGRSNPHFTGELVICLLAFTPVPCPFLLLLCLIFQGTTYPRSPCQGLAWVASARRRYSLGFLTHPLPCLWWHPLQGCIPLVPLEASSSGLRSVTWFPPWVFYWQGVATSYCCESLSCLALSICILSSYNFSDNQISLLILLLPPPCLNGLGWFLVFWLADVSKLFL